MSLSLSLSLSLCLCVCVLREIYSLNFSGQQHLDLCTVLCHKRTHKRGGGERGVENETVARCQHLVYCE